MLPHRSLYSGFFKPHITKVDFAIFTAMNEEMEYYEAIFSECHSELIKIENFSFKLYNYNNKKVILAQTGFGTTFASSILTFIFSHFHPNHVFLSGTAGGINPELRLCDVIIAEKAFEAEIQGAFEILKATPFEGCLTHPLNQQIFPSIYPASDELLEIANTILLPDIRLFKGTVVSSNTFPAPKELFEKIKINQPYSIDMETSAFYQIAWLLKIPVISIRGISNLLNIDGTDEKVHESDVRGSAEAAARVTHAILDTLIFKLNHRISLEVEVATPPLDEALTLVTHLGMLPHPEGGYYAPYFRSEMEVNPLHENFNQETRSAGTSIYYLLNQNDFSAWHSLKSDEVWHFYKGSSLNLHVIDKNGNLQTHILGDPTIHEGATFQVTVFANCWFAAEVRDKSSYTLVGCTVTPGFDFKDFILADRQNLSKKYAQHSKLINMFTRNGEDKKSETVEEFMCPILS